MGPKIEELCVYFPEEVPELKMNEFSNFLFHFRTIYAIACDFLAEFKLEQPHLDDAKVIKFRDYLLNFKEPPARTRYFFSDLGETELFITRIKKDSPVMLWVKGIVTALVLSAIIAGGEVDLRNLKFKLNPIGDGIAKMRAAFNPSGQIDKQTKGNK